MKGQPCVLEVFGNFTSKLKPYCVEHHKSLRSAMRSVQQHFSKSNPAIYCYAITPADEYENPLHSREYVIPKKKLKQ